jgi:hypothetical protein
LSKCAARGFLAALSDMSNANQHQPANQMSKPTFATLAKKYNCTLSVIVGQILGQSVHKPFLKASEKAGQKRKALAFRRYLSRNGYQPLIRPRSWWPVDTKGRFVSPLCRI